MLDNQPNLIWKVKLKTRQINQIAMQDFLGTILVATHKRHQIHFLFMLWKYHFDCIKFCGKKKIEKLGKIWFKEGMHP